MSSQGPYSRYSTPNNNAYGQGAGGGDGGGYPAPGYGGGQGYSAGPAPGYGGASYAAPEYKAQGSEEWNQTAENKQGDKSKQGKKSGALQALNKNVLMWAGFFSTSLFVFFILSGGDFSFLMTYGSMARMFGFGILNVKTFMSQRVTGVSAKSLQLYCLVFSFRLISILRHEGYLPYDKSGDWLYHVIELMGLCFSAAALWACMSKFNQTYQADLDKFGEFNVPRGFGAVWLAVPVFIFSCLVHPNLNNDFFSDVSWTYSMYLESVALIPQLYMFQKQSSGVVELMTAHFVAALGFGRIMELCFWSYSFHELVTAGGSTLPGIVALLSQFMQLILMLDFFWYYYHAVKNATPLVLPSHSAAMTMV
uniref:ER lumen protein-retaining receptor n=1 Tax=Eucampia antarctica TaxID=49252 RepID=A0A7S2SFV5_9STRA|mmetsp:Transcript_7662/g.7215  ORF Transcript_7662/g.7215 Transcript_7662/m.7215 type:complete len:365 (+) Transcript_7662:88-1182(+)|eukprot:CAMPEP_0197832198 /NCGR_PEP_ID=MMETSP1437-20131217/13634_1 /TAXON_ID=49252 ORGANISM="Eucampia antarctica, Strain CCMP1452" /NCGR_SAMPLE_ID=MMETSP1437 /ASSEMBLY_ACC=CAM_ASM_001096 /LENGTH=364 /DNA_ID=CAMNT_0043435425 /DNA_START=84 /DNA_END=1178 /DNA_ORIENTATION=+